MKRVSYPRSSLLLAALSCMFLASVTSPTRADVAVLIPAQAEQEVAAEQVERAVEELTRLLKLKGFDVISAGQAAAAAESEQKRGSFPASYDPLFCLTPACANEYRKLFDATFAVQLSLVTRGPRLSSVAVALTEAETLSFRGQAPVEGQDIRSAVRVAFEAARKRQEEGAGPWLSVSGSPAGATVYLDGVEYGKLPFEKRHIEPGEHKLEARAEGHENHTRTLSVPSAIDQVVQVTLELAPTGGPPLVAREREPATRQFRRSPWDWLVGGALVAAGSVHLVAGAYQKSKAGDCAELRDGFCTEYYGDSSGLSRENLLIGMGATGIVLGAAVMAFGPFGRLQMRASVDHAYVQLKREF